MARALPLKPSQQAIVDRLVAAIESGDTKEFIYPWLRDVPRSAISLNPYRGANHFVLNYDIAARNASGPPLFLSEREVGKRGGALKEGAKPYFVVFAGRTGSKKTKSEMEAGAAEMPTKPERAEVPESPAEPGAADLAAGVESSARGHFFIVEHRVFHLGDTENVKLPKKTREHIEEWEAKRTKWDSVEHHDKLRLTLKSAGLCPVIYGGNAAYYTRGADEVHMPDLKAFRSEIDHLTALAHELSHASGGPRHMRRDGVVGMHPQGSPAYALEECIAVVSSLQLCQDAGVTPSQEQIANWGTYLEGYGFLDLMKASPAKFFRCLTEAEFAANYIEEPEMRPEFLRARQNKTRQREFAFDEFRTSQPPLAHESVVVSEPDESPVARDLIPGPEAFAAIKAITQAARDHSPTQELE